MRSIFVWPIVTLLLAGICFGEHAKDANSNAKAHEFVDGVAYVGKTRITQRRVIPFDPGASTSSQHESLYTQLIRKGYIPSRNCVAEVRFTNPRTHLNRMGVAIQPGDCPQDFTFTKPAILLTAVRVKPNDPHNKNYRLYLSDADGNPKRGGLVGHYNTTEGVIGCLCAAWCDRDYNKVCELDVGTEGTLEGITFPR